MKRPHNEKKKVKNNNNASNECTPQKGRDDNDCAVAILSALQPIASQCAEYKLSARQSLDAHRIHGMRLREYSL